MAQQMTKREVLLPMLCFIPGTPNYLESGRVDEQGSTEEVEEEVKVVLTLTTCWELSNFPQNREHKPHQP